MKEGIKKTKEEDVFLGMSRNELLVRVFHLIEKMDTDEVIALAISLSD